MKSGFKKMQIKIIIMIIKEISEAFPNLKHKESRPILL